MSGSRDDAPLSLADLRASPPESGATSKAALITPEPLLTRIGKAVRIGHGPAAVIASARHETGDRRPRGHWPRPGRQGGGEGA
jgi:hypothetical protein